MSKQYYTVLTTYGSQQFAAAMANNRPLNITHFAVGDGNGRAIQPDSSRTALVRQVHKAAVSSISVDPRNNKQIIFELTLPETVGGFWVREMGLFDSQNRLIAHANCPDSYKPLLADGSGKIQILRMILLVSSSNAVSLTVDNRVIWATRNQLTPKKITATSTNQVTDDGHTHEIAKASTKEAGLVKLNDSLTSTSTEEALTAAQGKKLNDGKLSKSGDNATGDYTFDGNITQTGRERTIESNYRVRVKRNHPNYNPYMQVLNENIVEAANNREIGNYAFVIKNAEDVEITKAMLQARILEDKNATVEMALWDADQTKLIPWKVFSETNNTVFGATADNAKGRVQVHGNLWSSEAPIIENPTKWRAFNKRVADGMWTVDFAAVGSADKRFNFGFIPDDGSATTYLRFPKLTKDEVAAYQSWVLANAILQDGANEITGSLLIRSKNNAWSAIRLATKNGMWQLEANPNDDDKRLNLKHVGADGATRYIAFPAANDKNERVAYESWVHKIFAPLINPSFVGTMQTDYRIVVERNAEGWSPYTMLINAALNSEQPKNAVIGEHNHYVKNSKGDVVGKAQWSTNLVADGSATMEMALWDANQVKRIPWKAFATTNNTAFGKTTDDGENRVQINGTATVTAPDKNANNNQVPTTGWVNNFAVKKSGDTMKGELNVPAIHLENSNKRIKVGKRHGDNAFLEWDGGYISLNSGTNRYSGLEFWRADGLMRFEALDDRRFKFWVQGEYEIFTPKKSGTMALLEDCTPNLVPLFKGEYHSNSDSRNVTAGSVSGSVITLAQSFKNYRYLVVVTSSDAKDTFTQKILTTSLIPIGNGGTNTWDLGDGNYLWYGRFTANNKVQCIHENCVLHAIYGTNAI